MKPALCLLLAFPFLSLAQQTAPADSNHVVAVVEGMSWTAADLEQMTSALGGAIQMNFRSSPKAFLETFGLLLKLQQIADEEKLSESDPHKWRLLYNRALYLAQVRMNDQGTRTPITPEEPAEILR